MSLKDTIQTAFLIVGFFTLLVFGASYYFMFLDATPTGQPLKDSLSITASFFGGFATLTAAYIASKLFNDWKVQHNKSVENEFIFRVMDSFRAGDLSITNFRVEYDSYRANVKNSDNISSEEFEDLSAAFKSKLSELESTLLLFNVYREDLQQYCTIFHPDEYSKSRPLLQSILRSIKSIKELEINFKDPSSAFKKIDIVITNLEKDFDTLEEDINKVLLSRLKV